MSSIIEDVGFDLATHSEAQGWPVVDLYIDHKPIENFDGKVFDVILMTLPKMMNSMFVVGTDFDYVNAYVYSLAKLLDNREEFEAIVETHLTSYTSNSKGVVDGLTFAERYRQRVLGRRLFAIDLVRLSEKVSHDKARWNAAFDEMITLGQEKKYTYVGYNIHQVLGKSNKDNLYQAFRIFWSTRHTTNISFIAPMTWTKYVKDIEKGLIGSVTKSKHWTTISLDNRC